MAVVVVEVVRKVSTEEEVERNDDTNNVWGRMIKVKTPLEVSTVTGGDGDGCR